MRRKVLQTIREYEMLRPGDRVAQLAVVPVVQAALERVEELDDTGRGSGGFGSTGR